MARTGMTPSPTATWDSLALASARSLMWRSYRRGPAAWMAATTSAPARSEWPRSMERLMRGSRFLMAVRTSKGDGKFLSSGPWLWMASLMLYSLTNLSRRGRFSCVGAQTAMGIPAALRDSNLGRMSSSLAKVMLPAAVSLKPAARIGCGLVGNLIERRHGQVDILEVQQRRLELV